MSNNTTQKKQETPSSTVEQTIREVYIEPLDLKLKLSDDLLQRSGDYFKSMLNPSFGFKEVNQKDLKIEEVLHPDITNQNWNQYFKLVYHDYPQEQIAKLSAQQIYYLLLIAQYLQNQELMTLIEAHLDQRISREPLIDYLNQWVIYYLSFALCADPGKTESLIEHLEHRLVELVDTPQENSKFDSVLICLGEELLLHFGDQSTGKLDLYLQLYQIWWRVARPAIFNLLSTQLEIVVGDEQFGQANRFREKFLYDPMAMDLTFNPKLIPKYPDNCGHYQQVFIPNQTTTSDYPDDEADDEDQTPRVTADSTPSRRISRAIVRLEEVFPARWQALTLGLLDGIDWSNLFLAGGSVSKLLNPYYQHPSQFPINTDLDLFLVGNPVQQETKLFNLISWFLDKYQNRRVYLGIHRSLMNLWVEDLPRMIQIISSDTRSVMDTLCRFDLTHCQLAYDGTRFLATPAALIALQTGISELQLLNSSNDSNYYRLFKTQQAGYQLVIDRENAEKFAQLDDQQLSKFSNNYQFNYYFPSSQFPPEKNEFELRKHHRLTNVQIGRTAILTSLQQTLNQFQFNSDFKRSYHPRLLQTNIPTSEQKENKSTKLNQPVDPDQLTIGKPKKFYNLNFYLSQIKYQGSELSIRLPIMPLIFVNHQGQNRPDRGYPEINNKRDLILEVPSLECRRSLEQIDQIIINKLLSNRDHYLHPIAKYQDLKELRQMTDKEIRYKYLYFIRPRYDRETGEEYDLPPNLRIKVHTPSTKIYDRTVLFSSGKAIETAAELDKFNHPGRYRVQVTLYLKNIWLSSAGFGIKKLAAQVNIYPNSEQFQKILTLKEDQTELFEEPEDEVEPEDQIEPEEMLSDEEEEGNWI